ncbi:MAG TPA: DotU family type IV/VI secretion system protein [Bryobacteraceae bacterium]|nr:DotU family type IV/VI secretion system protein [Bryobacteraceae bacterium]
MGPQPEREKEDRIAGNDRDRQPENLSSLYQGVLTGIARLQSGRQHITDAESFRRRTKSALADIERVAINEGYDREDVKDSQFAVVAFLDEVVLHCSDLARTDWERRLLQEELFGQTDAGEVFFEKLARLESRRNSPYVVNTIEVFLTCLLLGFRGRYSGAQAVLTEGIVLRLTQRVREGRNYGPISPRGIPTARTAAAGTLPTPKSRYFREVIAGSIIFTLLLFLLFYWNLSSLTDQVLSVLGAKG